MKKITMIGLTYVISIISAQADGNFVTRWKLPDEQENLQFFLTRSGVVTYSWETDPSGLNGSGSFPEGDDLVKISGLPKGTTIRLQLGPKNLKRFYNDTWPPQPAPDRFNLLDVEQWGTATWSSMRNAFRHCRNMDVSATDMPNLQMVSDISDMFNSCRSLKGPQNIGSWDVSNVTSMWSVFYDTHEFDQDIGNWDVSNVENMNYLFYYAKNFNKDISNWNVSRVTSMHAMFAGAVRFNQPIGDWNVSNTEIMNYMFNEATSFDQPLNKWNISKVSEMIGMFQYARSFNQNLGNWELSSAVNVTDLFSESGVNCENYSATLIGWSQNNKTAEGLTIDATGLKYGSNAEAARAKLISDKKWNITGDAPSGEVCGLTSLVNLEAGRPYVYPNPVKDRLHISAPEAGLRSIELFDAIGKRLYISFPSDKYHSIDMSGTHPGLYYIRIGTDSSHEIYKVHKN